MNKELIENKYNEDYAVRRLADCYALLRDAKNAAKYYKKAVNQENIPIEYYYNYAQALRGIEKYDESKEWMKRYKDSGGVINTSKYLKLLYLLKYLITLHLRTVNVFLPFSAISIYSIF